jgi:hypothetical protein
MQKTAFLLRISVILVSEPAAIVKALSQAIVIPLHFHLIFKNNL